MILRCTPMQILLAIKDYASDILAVLAMFSIVIEVSPIKINPWSFLANKLGKAFNKEVLNEISTLKSRVDTLDERVQQSEAIQKERDAKTARTNILRFGDEIRIGTRHSKESFDEILSDITEYESYCSTHQDFKNNRTKSTEKIIIEVYEHCLRTDSFL